jgi:hypothetical protein
MYTLKYELCHSYFYDTFQEVNTDIDANTDTDTDNLNGLTLKVFKALRY